jgi:hypothetical protein
MGSPWVGKIKNPAVVKLWNPTWVFPVWTPVGPLSAYFTDNTKQGMRGERGGESGAQLGTTLRTTLISLSFVLQLQPFTDVWTFGCSHLVVVANGGIFH